MQDLLDIGKDDFSVELRKNRDEILTHEPIVTHSRSQWVEISSDYAKIKAKVGLIRYR
jgi:hypothetical protein